MAHQGIPKGLKLDASFTLIRTLERISEPGALLNSDGARDAATLVSEFLNRSASVYWLKTRSDGSIVFRMKPYRRFWDAIPGRDCHLEPAHRTGRRRSTGNGGRRRQDPGKVVASTSSAATRRRSPWSAAWMFTQKDLN